MKVVLLDVRDRLVKPVGSGEVEVVERAVVSFEVVVNLEPLVVAIERAKFLQEWQVLARVLQIGRGGLSVRHSSRWRTGRR